MHLRLKPRDVDNLTLAEFERMCAYADEVQRGIQRNNEEARRQ